MMVHPGVKAPSTFADIQGRCWALQTEEANYLLTTMPNDIRQKFVQSFLEPPDEGLPDVVAHFADKKISVISHQVLKSPGSAMPFEYLYKREWATPLDKYFSDCKAGHQIYKRLLSLTGNLPSWVYSLLDSKERLFIDNIGSGPGHYMLQVLRENPDLRDKVHVRNIDPDNGALNIGRRVAKDLGISNSFSFIGKKFREVPSRKADLVLLIGILCPHSMRMSRITLRMVGRYCRPGGLVIYSTALTKMVMDDPLTDFIMRFCGWNMTYKTVQESLGLATSLGWKVRGTFFDESLRHHCMVVAQVPHKTKDT